jgi:hypothetical protein
MDEKTRNCLDVVKDQMKKMTDDERMEIISELTELFCIHCGSDDPVCRCWDDE